MTYGNSTSHRHTYNHVYNHEYIAFTENGCLYEGSNTPPIYANMFNSY